jgi:hypothetical protein
MITYLRVSLLALLLMTTDALAADSTPVSREMAPDISLEDAVRIAKDYVAQQKWNTSSQFLRSAYFVGGADGQSYWAVTWIPRDRFIRDGQFTLKIAMDRSVTVERGK